MKSSTALKIFVPLGIVVALVLVLGGSYIGAYNYGAQMDNRVVAEYDDMKNVLGQYSLKVTEAVQVPGMKKDDLKEVTSAAMEGRYGPDGSKAVFQWIKEQYPGSVTDELYVKIQQIIESGRNEFENSQRKFIDTRRQYQTELDSFWSGMWLSVAGRPKINLEDYKIIESSQVK
jgi:hypothetical protein